MDTNFGTDWRAGVCLGLPLFWFVPQGVQRGFVHVNLLSAVESVSNTGSDLKNNTGMALTLAPLPWGTAVCHLRCTQMMPSLSVRYIAGLA